jgi:hypothetical protein
VRHLAKLEDHEGVGGCCHHAEDGLHPWDRHAELRAHLEREAGKVNPRLGIDAAHEVVEAGRGDSRNCAEDEERDYDAMHDEFSFLGACARTHATSPKDDLWVIQASHMPTMADEDSRCPCS